MIWVLGAGAFGTALAITLSRGGRDVTLWARDAGQALVLQDRRENVRYLPGAKLPPQLHVAASLSAMHSGATVLLALPAQSIVPFLADKRLKLGEMAIVACCKGIDLTTLQGPTDAIRRAVPTAVPAVLTGPSFAADLARGLPTALTLACADGTRGAALQAELSVLNLRVYLTPDLRGAELGGAFKNVIAIAAGITIGAGFGESARAAVIARGYAEMTRIAVALGAQAETLAGLSGLGDLVLTCTSTQSRNFRQGVAIGAGEGSLTGQTVEGIATAAAARRLAANFGVDAPLMDAVAAVTQGTISVERAVQTLLSRPLRQE
jgi:glycerol-3-phosphate dehydrogenase (NAD(P)+)